MAHGAERGRPARRESEGGGNRMSDVAERMGFFTDTTVCIGCKACEVACKQWNDLPADGSEFRKGGSSAPPGELSAPPWRHGRFVELLEPVGDRSGLVDVPGAVADMDR